MTRPVKGAHQRALLCAWVLMLAITGPAQPGKAAVQSLVSERPVFERGTQYVYAYNCSAVIHDNINLSLNTEVRLEQSFYTASFVKYFLH